MRLVMPPYVTDLTGSWRHCVVHANLIGASLSGAYLFNREEDFFPAGSKDAEDSIAPIGRVIVGSRLLSLT
jgi:hypothetical protein